jgi:hypothetical protein
MRTLDPNALFRSVLKRPDLDELELFVYVVKEIESRISMTGLKSRRRSVKPKSE